MLSIVRALFYKMPKPGDVYKDDDGNPFNTMTYTVLEVKGRWVRYTCSNWLPNSSLTVPRWVWHWIHEKIN